MSRRPSLSEVTCHPPQAGVRLGLRPMVRVTRIALFEREVVERLSRSALELIFARAEIISEGQRSPRAGRDAYFGSTMLTVDLQELASLLRDPCDAGCAERLARLIGEDPTAATRIRQIAARETERVAGAIPKSIDTQMHLRARGTRVFIDVDVEASF